MRYWDTSALALLLSRQPGWEQVRDWVSTDQAIVTSWLTPVECWSAFTRLLRTGHLQAPEVADAAERLREVLADAHEIAVAGETRDTAIAVLHAHPLRAADALHLASALLWTGGPPDGHEFVTFDQRLAEAARAEGFVVLTAAED